jgi:hypothetical protein
VIILIVDYIIPDTASVWKSGRFVVVNVTHEAVKRWAQGKMGLATWKFECWKNNLERIP